MTPASAEPSGEVTTVFPCGECVRTFAGHEVARWYSLPLNLIEADWRKLAESLAKDSAPTELKIAPSTNRAKSRKPAEINTTSFL